VPAAPHAFGDNPAVWNQIDMTAIQHFPVGGDVFHDHVLNGQSRPSRDLVHDVDREPNRFAVVKGVLRRPRTRDGGNDLSMRLIGGVTGLDWRDTYDCNS
jgi:hypothetical protein